MDITLVIPAHNEEGYIGDCVDAAKRTNGSFKEIIVVDNASSDKTADEAREHGARVVREERKGLSFARQAGLDACQSELVAYIDADTHLTENWFDIVQRSFEKYPHIVAVSGPRRYFGAAKWRCAILDAMWYVAPFTYRAVGYMILGGNFVARRSALEAIKGFDTSIAFYGEDTDIAKRLSKEGKVMFRMDLLVYASARRFEKEGIWGPNIVYMLNYLWPVLFGKPYTRTYQDVR